MGRWHTRPNNPDRWKTAIKASKLLLHFKQSHRLHVPLPYLMYALVYAKGDSSSNMVTHYSKPTFVYYNSLPSEQNYLFEDNQIYSERI